MLSMPDKKDDNDGICPINVISKKLINFNIDPKNVLFNLDLITLLANFFIFLDKTRSYITVDLILYAPNVANFGFLRIVLTIAL